MVDPPYRMKNMMPGMIMLWYGSIATIPSGWHLCDGAMGTPNLATKFVMCVGGPFSPGDAGGNVNHDHTFTGDGHTHTHQGAKLLADGTDRERFLTTDPAVGTTDLGNSMPPYHALCYIMKL